VIIRILLICDYDLAALKLHMGLRTILAPLQSVHKVSLYCAYHVKSSSYITRSSQSTLYRRVVVNGVPVVA
jgi:hypothetical protein